MTGATPVWAQAAPLHHHRLAVAEDGRVSASSRSKHRRQSFFFFEGSGSGEYFVTHE
jgi:hypothetical protein